MPLEINHLAMVSPIDASVNCLLLRIKMDVVRTKTEKSWYKTGLQKTFFFKKCHLTPFQESIRTLMTFPGIYF
jgi:hypothetical protein